MDALTVSNSLLASMQEDFEKAKPVFPTFLNVSIQIKKAIDREDFSLDLLIPLIRLEPMMAARLMGLANSAFYCRSGVPVKDIKGAIMRLGCSVVRSVAFATATKQLIDGEDLRVVRYTVSDLWKHSMTTASWAHTLATYSKAGNPDEAMFVGMVQNIGKFYVLSKIVKLTSDRALILECVQQWHQYAAIRLMDALGVKIQIKRATSTVYHGSIPPTSFVEILQCATVLSELQNPISNCDSDVATFLMESLEQRFGPEYPHLIELYANDYSKSIGALFQ